MGGGRWWRQLFKTPGKILKCHHGKIKYEGPLALKVIFMAVNFQLLLPMKWHLKLQVPTKHQNLTVEYVIYFHCKYNPLRQQSITDTYSCPSLSCEITWLNMKSERLIQQPSLSRSPLEPVWSSRSEPAKSTKFKCETWITPSSPSFGTRLSII